MVLKHHAVKGKIMSNSVQNLSYPPRLMDVKRLLYPSLPRYFEETKMSGNNKMTEL